MSVKGSETEAEHQSKMRFCPEKSPKPPQVSVLKEVAYRHEPNSLCLPDVVYTEMPCAACRFWGFVNE